MIGFLQRLFGGERPSAAAPRRTTKPPLPEAELETFKTWFLQQTCPAIALTPDASLPIAATGSRLGGPAWLAAGEDWPRDRRGVPLEFIAQLDCTDCRELGGYPDTGIIQFFVARNDLYGADFDDPAGAAMLVRRCDIAAAGALVSPPPLALVAGLECSDCSPFENLAVRATGIGLRPTLITDRIDRTVMAAEQRVMGLYERYDATALEGFLRSEAKARPPRHHSGGYPVFTQDDVRFRPAFADFDHVLLRLTSDTYLMWGDAGECLFLIRSEDLARGDLSRVAYSWDCY
ncbi:YwqG family protein [Sphingomonas sp. MMS24-J45]|uniref:YwqG family protein n=1 Tax=Sphingomonas sp. MMS24-J45 TaxID=3238806 RepID=UPI00384E5AE7